MTAVLDRIPVDEISAQAQRARPGRAVLTVIAAVFFGLGWLMGSSVLALSWAAVAVRAGWQEGRKAQRVSRGAT